MAYNIINQLSGDDFCFMPKRVKITQTGLLFFIAVLHIAAVIISGIINILFSLHVETVPAAAATVSSFAALAVYVAGAFAVYHRRSAELAGFGLAFWGVTLFGFVFYSVFNIFEIPITIIIPNMTALLRILMMIFTLPLLAYNYLIAAIPNLWVSFICALLIPAAFFAINLMIYIKIKKTAAAAKKNNEKT